MVETENATQGRDALHRCSTALILGCPAQKWSYARHSLTWRLYKRTLISFLVNIFHLDLPRDTAKSPHLPSLTCMAFMRLSSGDLAWWHARWHALILGHPARRWTSLMVYANMVPKRQLHISFGEYISFRRTPQHDDICSVFLCPCSLICVAVMGLSSGDLARAYPHLPGPEEGLRSLAR